MNYVFYDTDTGRITGTGSNPLKSGVDRQKTDPSWGVLYDVYADPDTEMVVGGEIQDKPPATDAELNSTALKSVRSWRNQLLQGCDWTVLDDNPLTEAEKDEWKVYRQTLRDIPATSPDIKDFDEIVWPVEP